MRQTKLLKLLAFLAFSFFGASVVLGDAVIFNGSAVKTLKDQLKLKDTASILTGTDDPTAVAKNAPKGSLYLQQGTAGKVYVKLDTGSSTNWSPVAMTAGVMTANRALQTDASGNVVVSSTVSDVELAFLDGVTSAIQTQLNGKANYSNGYTSGAIPFSNGTTLTDDPTNFFFDNTTDNLGIGTNTPRGDLDIYSEAGTMVLGGTVSEQFTIKRMTGAKNGTGSLDGGWLTLLGGHDETSGAGLYLNGNSSGYSAGSPQFTLGKATSAFDVYDHTISQNRFRVYDTGHVGIGTGESVPTASLEIRAGTAGASGAPLKFTAGTNLTTPEAGAIEYNGTNLFYTVAGPTRHTIANLDEAQTVTGAKTYTDNLSIDNNKALRLYETDANGSDFVSIITPASVAASYTMTLPVDDGASGEVLTTDGSGNLSWSAAVAASHNSLSGLQGGTTGEYYHWTSTEYGERITASNTSGMTNKSLDDTSTRIIDTGDGTKKIAFNAGGTAGTTTTLTAAQTSDRTVTLPDATATLSGLSVAETFSGVKTFNDGSLKLNGATSGASTLKAPAVASTYVHTLPAATDTLVGLATTDTLTNKSLTSPNINTQATVKAAGELRFNNASDTFYTGFKGGNAGANKIWTLPTADGTASQALTTDGSGVLGWSTFDTTSTAQYNVKVGNSGGTATQTDTNLLGNVSAAAVSATVTITIATPGVVTYTSHGLSTGDRVYLTTTGALPTGLSASTTYYVYYVSANTFQLATSLTNAQSGTTIATSGSQSGTHTLYSGGFNLKSTLDIVTSTRIGLMRYSHGTNYNGGNAPTITEGAASTGTLNSITYSAFFPYQAMDGGWWLRGTFTALTSSDARTSFSFAINGVTTPNVGATMAFPILAMCQDGTTPTQVTFASIDNNSANFNVQHASAATDYYWVSFEIPLASKPSWAY